MPMRIINKDDQYLLNHCTKYLARDDDAPRHDFGQYTDDATQARYCEAWRFPIVDRFSDGDPVAGYHFNEVTFIYAVPRDDTSTWDISVVGSFGNLFEPIPLTRVGDSAYYAATVVVPKGQVHTYKFFVDGVAQLDLINPQKSTLENDEVWSRFFTDFCVQPISFERWELAILERLTDHILPLRTKDGQRFLNYYYNYLDGGTKQTMYPAAYRFDESIGVVNYIDKVVAREETHHFDDYKICLELIDDVLRQRNPFVEPFDMSKEMFIELHGQMAINNVIGWDYGRYGSPRFFLQLLRRHTWTGAFCHPKYGGNAGAAGWMYLEDLTRDADGKTLFDWRRAIEKPLGNSEEYRG